MDTKEELAMLRDDACHIPSACRADLEAPVVLQNNIPSENATAVLRGFQNLGEGGMFKSNRRRRRGDAMVTSSMLPDGHVLLGDGSNLEGSIWASLPTARTGSFEVRFSFRMRQASGGLFGGGGDPGAFAFVLGGAMTTGRRCRSR